MKSSHLTVAAFCHVLLASLVVYFTSTANVQASPLTTLNEPKLQQAQPVDIKPQQVARPPGVAVAAPAHQAHVPQLVVADHVKARSGAPAPQVAPVPVAAAAVVPKEAVVQPKPAVAEQPLVLTERKIVAPSKEEKDVKPAAAEVKPAVAPIVVVAKSAQSEPQARSAVSSEQEKVKIEAAPKKVGAAVSEPQKKDAVVAAKSAIVEIAPKSEQPAAAAPVAAAPVAAAPVAAAPAEPVEPVKPAVVSEKPSEVPQPRAAALVAPAPSVEAPKPEVVAHPIVEPVPVVVVAVEPVKPVVEAPPVPVVGAASKPEEVVKPVVEQQQPAPLAAESAVEPKSAAPAPVVMGGLGPLHLLATTLCSYQPDKLVADEHLNQLYARRASVRKSLFEFMSLKFTNLEKLSSRLGYGLQVVPVKLQPTGVVATPSHGWPVVGKCTAYDLKLMGEAAWCECHEGDQGCPAKPTSAATAAVGVVEEAPARIASNQHAAVAKVARSIASVDSFLPSPDESSVISKLLHVNDIKDAPTVESTIYNLNLTQHQLATLEAHATSTQECRRNALRYSKALFNHLAEDQRERSESWPRLYALISNDDCARRRMIDIFNALSSFRTDTTSIRRDNLEFAFAMDDLRAKVLENEVNVPLTFDRHFIEVEQFLQQSVRLMLANIQPKRAKLTSMRYRSLMYGASPQAADDQCIDLHQRLLARNYPNDCNPTQFGQLPDSLRMTASSLELWSIEKALSLHMAKVADYPNSSAVGQQKVKENVNECIANLVSS